MDRINAWWGAIPGERFWLGVTSRSGTREVLAAPSGARRGAPCWARPLIAHAQEGDALFHYDEAREAIVAWSTICGRAQRKPLVLSRRGLHDGAEDWPPTPTPSWVVELDMPTPLESIVSIEQIARIQSDLFPALRALEDKVGGPLYYPFAIAGPADSRLLAGYVFKLPSLFVGCLTALAAVADCMSWSATARSRSTETHASATRPAKEVRNSSPIPLWNGAPRQNRA